jgi:hypothetical protein
MFAISWQSSLSFVNKPWVVDMNILVDDGGGGLVAIALCCQGGFRHLRDEAGIPCFGVGVENG